MICQKISAILLPKIVKFVIGLNGTKLNLKKKLIYLISKEKSFTSTLLRFTYNYKIIRVKFRYTHRLDEKQHKPQCF